MSNLAKVLIVDDQENLLSGLRRQFRNTYDMTTATSADDALAKIDADEPFAVVVTDMKMPGMDGIAFLEAMESASPTTVRMMLTGNADQDTAVKAINSGKIFRFFNKPCDLDTLREGIDAGIMQFRLHTAERDLVEKTLSGSIKLLSDVLSMTNPHEARRRELMRVWARKLAVESKMAKPWELDLAVMLSHVGMIGVPVEISEKFVSGSALSDEEMQLVDAVPQVGADLVANIPRMEGVATGIRYQCKSYSGAGFPHDNVAGADIPLIGRAMKILCDLADLAEGHHPGAAIFATMRERMGAYDENLLNAAERALKSAPRSDVEDGMNEVTELIPVSLLRPGQVLLTDIVAVDGRLILSQGCTLSEVQVQRIKAMHKGTPVAEPIKVAQKVRAAAA